MIRKSAVLRVRVEPEPHKQFIELCASMNLNGSAVLRQAIQAFIERHNNNQQADMFQQVGKSGSDEQ